MIKRIINEITMLHSYSDLKKFNKRVIKKIKNIFFEDLFGTIKAFYYLNKNKNKKNENEKIRIVFLAQEASMWGKTEPVFERMEKYPEFERIVLAIPHYDISVISNKENFSSESFMLDYYENPPCLIINAKSKNNEWFNLRKLKPDYVFYQRPYDQYLPEPYRSKNIVKYAKICYIPYSYFDSYVFKCMIKFNFMKNVSFFFADNDEILELVKKRHWLTQHLGLKKIINQGYPVFEKIIDYSKKQNNKSKKVQLMWTPRWTIDEKISSSNFFRYKDLFLEFMNKKRDVFFICRPHPAAFENFIREDLMSYQDVEDYKQRYKNLKNAELDISGNYLKKLLETDILVSDESGLVIEFFLLGKPIIYCGKLEKMTKTYKKIYNTFYLCKTWDEIEITINNLICGVDPLKEKRTKLKDEIKKKHMNASDKIIDCLIKNYK